MRFLSRRGKGERRESLFATGLVAGGVLAGALVAILSSVPSVNSKLGQVNAEPGLSEAVGGEGYKWLGVGFFVLMGYILYKIAFSKKKTS